MGKKKCIYCLEDRGPSEFNKEHVLPKAFGKFRHNLTLTDCVCIDCNGYFGNNLELFLSRDSIEALRRLQYGLKPLAQIGQLHLDRLEFSIAKEGEWKGVRLRPKVEGDELVVEPFPQVGLARRGGRGWIYLTENELADSKKPLPKGVDPKVGIKVFFPSESVGDHLISLLAARGITFEKKTELPPPPSEEAYVLQEISYRIDPIIRRCAAKIAFNYMAYVAGADFTNYEDFDVTRRFIRHGIVPAYPLVLADNVPILRDELPMWRRRTSIHLITLNWSPSQEHVVAQVSLFNEITYRISLARYFSGVWRDIRSGHCFDVSEHSVRRLVGTSMTIARGIRPRS